MTLDIAKFISNSIKTQAKVQHLDVSTKTVARDAVPKTVAKLIEEDYGEKYLLDADYVSFFWGAIGKEEIKKLFNVVDKALGKSANKLTSTDFKKVKIEDEEVVIKQQEIEVDDDDGEEKDEEREEVEVDNEEVNEDEDSQASMPIAYFFLKITLK